MDIIDELNDNESTPIYPTIINALSGNKQIGKTCICQRVYYACIEEQDNDDDDDVSKADMQKDRTR